MAKTVVGLFDRFEDAQLAVDELIQRGISRNDISLVTNDASGRFAQFDRERAIGGDKMDDTAAEQAGSGALAGAGVGAGIGLLVGLGMLAIPGIGPVLAAGPLATVLGSTALGAGVGAASGGLIGPLVDAGVPRPDAEIYHEGVRRGGTLVIAHTSDDMAQDAIEILNRHGPVEIDERAGQYRQSGWTGYNEGAEPYSADEVEGFRARQTAMPSRPSETSRRTDVGQDEGVLPVVEEQLQVDKRLVERGRARIHTKVTEQPVEEQVNLREERVDIDRRKVDRPVEDADAAFQEQSFEVTETAEEPVVRKQARVTEEVVVRKDVDEHSESVQDTVRRQDVHVHGGEATAGPADYDAFDADFRSHYQRNAADSGYTYEQYSPVYRYGHLLATERNYQGKEWSAIEPDARRRWEERNPGTWDRFKDSVRHAWERVSGKR